MINCLIIEDELPAQTILRSYIADTPSLALVGCCGHALDAIPLLQSVSVDVLFLDIHLPKLSGLQFLRSATNPPQVIITSAYPQYALDGFELNVVDYLLKPFSFERFIMAVNKCSYPPKPTPPTTSQTAGSDYIFIKMNKGFQKIRLSDILFIAADKDFVKIHVSDTYYLELQALRYYEQALPDNFARVHKSYVVNLEWVTALNGNELTIQHNTVPVGRSYRAILLRKLGLQ